MFKRLKRLLGKNLFSGEDGKPLTVSFFLQRDACSRLHGEYGEKHLPHTRSEIIVGEMESGDLLIVSSENLTDSQAAGMLLQAANRVSMDNGK